MALVLNEEQRMLRDSTRDFLRDNANVEHFRELRDTGDGLAFNAGTWSQLVELGLSAIPAPEAYGGLDFGYMALGAVFEEFGKQLTATPMLSSIVLCGSLLELAGSEAQKQSLLPELIEGRSLMAFALDESSHHKPSATQLSAEQEGDELLLSGHKQFVVDGMAAGQLIVACRVDGSQGLSLCLVPTNAEGLSRSKSNMVDSRDYAELQFDQVRVSTDSLLGAVGSAEEAIDTALDRARACLAAEMLGASQALFDRTVEYLREREQFGAKIGSFQALQHRAADMYTELELTRTAVVAALSALDENTENAAMMVSMAKARSNDTLQRIANEAVQMHGGIGVTDELDIGLFLKRARLSVHLLGNSGFHEDRFASLNGF